MREDWRCVFLHLNLRGAQRVAALFRTAFQLLKNSACVVSDMLLPSDMSSSSRRLIPISCEGALRLSVGVGNSGKDGGDCGDVSSPDRSSNAVPPVRKWIQDRQNPGTFQSINVPTLNISVD